MGRLVKKKKKDIVINGEQVRAVAEPSLSGEKMKNELHEISRSVCVREVIYNRLEENNNDVFFSYFFVFIDAIVACLFVRFVVLI